MPIYEYRCGACGLEFQAIRRISDETMPPCRECGSEDVVKKMSLSAFHLKGSGWYKTDYAKDKAGVNPKAEKGGENGDGPGESKPSEAKPTEPTTGESKPAASAASESKPSESKPAKTT